MLNHGNNTVETPENSFSKDPLWQKIESLEKEIKSLRKQNQLNSGIIRLGVIGLIGYIIATNWSAIAPASATAATATVAAAPVIGIVIGAIIGAAVLVGASYAAWRYRAEIKAGFKYAAEKTVEGAKHTAKKTVEGAKDLYGRAKKVVNSVTYYDHDHQNAFLKKMTEFTPENNENYEKIREQLKVVSNEKDGNILLKNILSEIGSMIDSKIADKEKLANTDLPKAADKLVSDANKPANTNQPEADKLLLSEWKMQREFIKGLNSKSLNDLVNDKTGFPRDHYLITKIFSEHHSEIKEVIKDESTRFKAIDNLNKAAGAYLRMNRRGSARSTYPGLSIISSMSSLNSNSTDGSTKVLLNPEEHKEAPTSPWNRLSLLFKGNKAPKEAKEATEVKYTVLPGLDGEVPPETVDPTRLRGNSSFTSSNGFPAPAPVVPPKVPGSPTSSCDSGINSPNPSGSSTPTTKPVFLDDAKFKEKLEKRRASVDQPNVEPVNLRVEIPGAGN